MATLARELARRNLDEPAIAAKLEELVTLELQEWLQEDELLREHYAKLDRSYAVARFFCRAPPVGRRRRKETPEQIRARCAKSLAARMANTTPERRQEIARKGGFASAATRAAIVTAPDPELS